MPKRSKEDQLADIHAEAMEDFDEIQKAQRDERMQCLQDRRFYSMAGAQWEGAIGELFENKPRFELNKVHLSVIRIFNEYRNNRITVDFTPKDGTQNDKLADTCDGLYRADEQACTADEAYDNAFEEGVGGGFGAWRLRTCYEDEDDDENDKQRIVIEPIFDADSCVFFDLDAKRQDKADATRCYVLTPYTRKGYKAEWGTDPADWGKDIDQREFDWCSGDIVWVCELYKVEKTKETVHIYRGLDGMQIRVPEHEFEEDPDKEGVLLATGFRKVSEKRAVRRRVHKYIMDGNKVLSDEGYIAGKCIPIVPFFGKRWVIDGIERCMGHVRLAKDGQRLLNMLLSWLAEMASRFDIEKPILTPEQIKGHAQMWASDNIQKWPYLHVNPITDENGQKVATGPIGYTKAPSIPPAWAALVQIASDGLQDVLGKADAAEEVRSNVSGKAVELIQNRLDMQAFIYLSNLAKSMKRSGEIWLSMAKDIVVEPERRMKTMNATGEAGSVVMNQPAYDPKTAATYTENSLEKASMDVAVSVGPSSNSLRAAVVRALTGIAQITDDPETKQALTLATIANIEGEGLADLREWARARALRMGLVKPTEEEAAQLQQEQQASQQPGAQEQYLMAEAAKAMEETRLAGAKTIDTLAAAELKQAQTAKTASEVGVAAQAQRNDVLKSAAGLGADMRKHQDGQSMHREDRDHAERMADKKPAEKQ